MSEGYTHRRVVMTYTFTVEVSQPIWEAGEGPDETAHNAEFVHNEGTSCATNFLRGLWQAQERLDAAAPNGMGCPCVAFMAKALRVREGGENSSRELAFVDERDHKPL